MRHRYATLALFLACAGTLAAASYDIVVIGGTPAGIAAAIAGARAGYSVALVEETPVLGGMLSNGVSRSDDAVIASSSGVFEEFRRRIQAYHEKHYANDPVFKAHAQSKMVRHNVARGQAWEPKIAAQVYAGMVAEYPTIRTFFKQVPVGATTEGNRIRSVTTRDANGAEHRYQGRVFIDATYEADVAAFAKAAFRVGREPRTPEEPHAGEIHTDAFCEGQRTLQGTIFPGGSGRGDHKIMAYNFRFIVKDYGKADGPHRLKTPPPGYNARNYKWSPAMRPYLPNGKLDVLNINWGNDTAGPNYDYPTATWEQRARIIDYYKNFALGYLYFMQTEGGSPQWGLPEDEFIDNGGFPYKMYVREARRIDGVYRLTESDLHKDLRGDGLRGPLQRDSIAIGIYEIDSHNVVNPTDRTSPCSGEGAINLTDVTGPYQIPYGVLVPEKVDGLLVPVGISATHVAFSSIRMEPAWSSLGQAAGVAAALALRDNKAPREVPVPSIQAELLRQGSKLFFYQDVAQSDADFGAIERMSMAGAIDGDASYYFRPTHPVTLGDTARLLVRGLRVPLSITAQHFIDAPRGHAAFRYLETLYDAGTSQGRQLFDYEPRNFLAYPRDYLLRVYAYPNHPVDRAAFARMAVGLLRLPANGGDLAALRSLGVDLGSSPAPLTRAEAARYTDAIATAVLK